MTTSSSTSSVATTAPVQTLRHKRSRIFIHLHALLILLSYYFQFGRIVLNPVPSLAFTLLPVSIIQASYVVNCLPLARRKAATSPERTGKATARKKDANAREDGDLLRRVVVCACPPMSALSSSSSPADHSKPAVLSLLLALLLGTPALTISMILLGAPLTTHLPHTLLASAHFSVLAFMPLIYVHGIDSTRWRDVISLMLPVDEVFGAALGTILGAWFGALPIPLDW